MRMRPITFDLAPLAPLGRGAGGEGLRRVMNECFALAAFLILEQMQDKVLQLAILPLSPAPLPETGRGEENTMKGSWQDLNSVAVPLKLDA